MVFTAVDAPLSNGLNERFNQTLIIYDERWTKVRVTLRGQPSHKSV